MEERGGGFSLSMPADLYVGLTLGDRRAAADVAWVTMVQALGDERFIAAGSPGLEKILTAVTTLDPEFRGAYLVASGFLSSDATRHEALDTILSRGERAIPNDFALPMSRGFAAYFGAYDLTAAARHFRTAANMSGSPAYLRSFAEHLDHASSDCQQLQSFLSELSNTVSAPTPSTRAVLISCIAREIERAAAVHRLRTGEDLGLEALIERGALKPPLAPPGECWHLDGKATLAPCGMDSAP